MGDADTMEDADLGELAALTLVRAVLGELDVLLLGVALLLGVGADGFEARWLAAPSFVAPCSTSSMEHGREQQRCCGE